MSVTQPPRVFVRFSKDQYDQFSDWAKRLGVPVANLVALCAWTGSHTLIPRMLPNVHQQLEFIRESEEADLHEWQSEVLDQLREEDTLAFGDFQKYREEFEVWMQQRSVSTDE